MKTEIKINERKGGVKFSDLKIGDMFFCYNIDCKLINMKINPIITNGILYNCVQIYFPSSSGNGALYVANQEELVTPIKELKLDITI